MLLGREAFQSLISEMGLLLCVRNRYLLSNCCLRDFLALDLVDHARDILKNRGRDDPFEGAPMLLTVVLGFHPRRDEIDAYFLLSLFEYNVIPATTFGDGNASSLIERSCDCSLKDPFLPPT